MSKKHLIHSCDTTGELFENQEAQYFVKHPNMKWLKYPANVPTFDVYNLYGAILIESPFDYGFVGRINVTLANGTYQQIGKLFTNDVFYYIADNVSSEIQATTDEIDILVCQ